MLSQYENFLKQEYLPLLHKLIPGQQGKWGKMDAQQMVEHMEIIFKVANGSIPVQLANTDPVKRTLTREFMFSEQAFPEGIRVPGVPEEPNQYKHTSLEEAIARAAKALDEVFVAYHNDTDKLLMHPMLGELNYSEQIHYLYRHSRHHLKQFGLVD